jgi:uncharacterized surface protein with fasciclin (FAS1) repeats
MSNLNVNGLKRPGLVAVQQMPSLVTTLKKEQMYTLFSMSNLNFIGIKRPGLVAIILMPSLVTTLKKEQRYTLLFNE